jgi:hypothetical protein
MRKADKAGPSPRSAAAGITRTQLDYDSPERSEEKLLQTYQDADTTADHLGERVRAELVSKAP